MSFLDQQKAHFRQADISVKLIYINVVLFVLSLLLMGVFRLHNLLGWVTLSNYQPLYYKPWTIVTYSFFHSPDDLFHLISNMLFLYYFGRFFLYYFSQKMFLNVYLLGAITGGVFFLLLAYFIPGYYTLLGASASIYAIMSVVITYQPNQEVRLFGVVSVKLWHIALFFVVLNLVQLNNEVNQGGIWAHIGGVLVGYLYLKQFNRGEKIGQTLKKISSLFKRRSNPSFRYTKNRRSPKSDEEFNAQKKKNQGKIDEILEKISRSGYESLTKEEKSFLFNNR